MAHTFEISSSGLKLIKAYEGFRPTETTLVSGQRVIGYGHRFQDSEEPAISRNAAEDLLKSDLEAYEDVVNNNIFAPMNQNQFDALVSLSFNIGPQKFLSSSVLHALNNGRPLAAASGFDEWVKSVIDGKTYVVDALVRRRTAEKSLFLEVADGVVAAPRHELPPKRDLNVQAVDADVEVFDKTSVASNDVLSNDVSSNDISAQEQGIVAQTPYAAQDEIAPHPIGGAASILSLCETDEAKSEPEADEIEVDAEDPNSGANTLELDVLEVSPAEISSVLPSAEIETDSSGEDEVAQAIDALRALPSARRDAVVLEDISKAAPVSEETSPEDVAPEDVVSEDTLPDTDVNNITALPTHSDVDVVIDMVAEVDADVNNVTDIVAEVEASTNVETETDIDTHTGADIITDEVETTPQDVTSPIALAAEEVSERLDRLIADTGEEEIPTAGVETPAQVLPQSDQIVGGGQVAEEKSRDIAQVIADIKAANEGTDDDYRRPGQSNFEQTNTPDAYIQKSDNRSVDVKKPGGFGAYWVFLIVGGTLLAGGAMKWFLTPSPALDAASAFVAPAATIVGAMVVIGALYYMMKTAFRRKRQTG